MRVLRLTDVTRAKSCITAACAIEDLRFHFTVWYEDVDLDELARVHGADLLDRIALHVALFQFNAVVSLAPDVVDLGPYARHLTPSLAALWRTVVKNVWAQWRWEHDRQDYLPRFATEPVEAMPTPGVVGPAPAAGGPAPAAGRHALAAGGHAPTELLAFCGGGKDSLVALRLLERAGLPFATLGYAHSIYGAAAPQHALLDRLGAATGRTRAERQTIIDDFLDAPIVRTRPDLGAKSLLAAETPASIFAALPIALARGYRGLVLAHEASANAANLEWNGEAVNHQWGKSWEAEMLLESYVRTHLLSNVRYFSILAPIHDEVIFELLARDAELAPLTHSCNVKKPWCGDCAKCAYVWLQFAAHLPPEIVARTFGDNFGERAANEVHFRELLGLAEHSPFECVGSVPEARLAVAQARARGALGPRLSELAARVEQTFGPIDAAALAKPLVEVGAKHHMPDHVAAGVMPQLEAAARSAAARLGVR